MAICDLCLAFESFPSNRADSSLSVQDIFLSTISFKLRKDVVYMRRINRWRWWQPVVRGLLLVICASAVLGMPAVPTTAQGMPAFCPPTSPPPRPTLCGVVVRNADNDVAMRVEVRVTDITGTRNQTVYLPPQTTFAITGAYSIEYIRVTLAEINHEGVLAYENTETTITLNAPLFNGIVIDLSFNPNGDPYFFAGN